MAADTPFEYTLGERIYLSIGVTPAGTSEVDFSIHDVTVNLDHESGTRFTFEYRPTEAGTAADPDEVFELIDDELFFELTSTWTAENMTEGRWVMSTSVFDPATDQDEVAVVYIDMIKRPGGPLPVV